MQPINLSGKNLETQVVIQQDTIEINHDTSRQLDQLDKNVKARLTFKNFKQTLYQKKTLPPDRIQKLARQLCQKFNFTQEG